MPTPFSIWIRQALFPAKSVLVAALLPLALATSVARAAQGDCGFPVTSGSLPKTSDALFVLRGAVGLETCPLRVCDIDGNAEVRSSDALRLLRIAVGTALELLCPGEASSTTTSTSSSSTSFTTSTSTLSTTSTTLAATWAEVQAVFAVSCAGSACHTGEHNEADLGGLDDLEQGFAALVNVPSVQSNAGGEEAPLRRVEPGDAEASYLIHKLEGTHLEPPANGSGLRMPAEAPRLTAEFVARIRAWINAGAAAPDA